MSASRLVTGALILAAHVALVIAVWQGTVVRQQRDVTSFTLQTLAQPVRTVRVQAVAAPQLATFSAPAQPMPEIKLPADPDTTVIRVVAAPTPAPAMPAVAPASPAAAPSAAMPAMSQIAYLERPQPRYPPLSRRAREEGLVILHVIVDERGRVIRVAVQQSSGHARLDEAAADAVSRALFKPYSEGGIARRASAIIPIEFSLHQS